MTETFEDGYQLGSFMVHLWNAAGPHPGGFYIGGHRIRREEAGLVLEFLGAVADKPALEGFGAAVAQNGIGGHPRRLGNGTARMSYM